jgi:hypothetical protein
MITVTPCHHPLRTASCPSRRLRPTHCRLLPFPTTSRRGAAVRFDGSRSTTLRVVISGRSRTSVCWAAGDSARRSSAHQFLYCWAAAASARRLSRCRSGSAVAGGCGLGPVPHSTGTAAPAGPDRTMWIIAAVLAVELLACFGISATGFLVLRNHDFAAGTTTNGEPGAGPSGKTFADAATFTPILSRYAFQRGFVRRRVDAAGTIVAVRLFQFGLTEFADDFAEYLKQANEHQGWNAPTAVPAADGADTQVRPGREAGGSTRSACSSRTNCWPWST